LTKIQKESKRKFRKKLRDELREELNELKMSFGLSLKTHLCVKIVTH